jgi:DNA helicase-2/ATP-dependent DNA helicase PcrA
MSELTWSDGLSDEQAQAASGTGSHARLLAGPGTGKTHTLARRVIYLVTQDSVPPSEILALTFTRTAARDLRSKIRQHLAPYTDEIPHVSTLHSFALRQLRRNASLIDSLPLPLRIADDWEESTIIQEEMKALTSRDLSAVKDGFNRLSADWETLQADNEGWPQSSPDAAFVGTWEDHRRVYGYTLRAELVYQLKKAMEQIPEFGLELGFKHVLIDEYQDLNPCDLAVGAALAAKGAMLLACGDDDQSIYGFRYADPSGIRDFVAEFPGAVDLQLTECHRCGSAILEAALWVARQDANRVDKELRAIEGRPSGDVHLLSFRSGTSETEGVAQLCRQAIEDGTQPGDILILLRSDRSGVFSAPLQRALNAVGIEVNANTEKQGILEGNAGRQLLSMLQLIVNPFDHLAWRTRLQIADGIGPTTARVVYDFAAHEGTRFGQAVHRLEEFEHRVPNGTRRALQNLVQQTLETMNRHAEIASQETEDLPGDLLERISAVAAHEIPEEEQRSAVLAKLKEVIDGSSAATIQDLLLGVAIGREAFEPELDEDRVNILTMHQAKELSADVVFIVAAEDEMLPHRESASAIGDDRRLLYVSMTRARHKLFITYSGRRSGGQAYTGRNSGNPVRHLSRFLRNSPLRPENGQAFVEMGEMRLRKFPVLA